MFSPNNLVCFSKCVVIMVMLTYIARTYNLAHVDVKSHFPPADVLEAKYVT